MKMFHAFIVAIHTSALGQFRHRHSVLLCQTFGYVCPLLGCQFLKRIVAQLNHSALRLVLCCAYPFATSQSCPFADGFLHRRMIRGVRIWMFNERLTIQPSHRVRLNLVPDSVALGDDPHVGPLASPLAELSEYFRIDYVMFVIQNCAHPRSLKPGDERQPGSPERTLDAICRSVESGWDWRKYASCSSPE